MDLTHKLVAVLNKELPTGVALNALGHICLGLGNNLETSNLLLDDYQDGEGNIYPNISKMPFIILRGKSSEIRKIINSALEQNIKHGIFVNTMTGGTYKEQLENTKNASAESLIYYGCVLYGLQEELSLLTKRLSLWRNL